MRLGNQRKSNILILPFQEVDHDTDMVSRAKKDSKTPEEMKDSQSMVEDAQLPLEQKKRKIQRNLRTLEQMGYVSSKNKYQDILNEIAKVLGNNILSLLSRHCYSLFTFWAICEVTQGIHTCICHGQYYRLLKVSKQLMTLNRE